MNAPGIDRNAAIVLAGTHAVLLLALAAVSVVLSALIRMCIG